MRKPYFAVLALGLAGIAGDAAAQYYPPGPYHVSGPYRGAPVDVDDDDFDGPEAIAPPPLAPRASGAIHPYEAQPLPPPGAYGRPPLAAPPPGGYAEPPFAPPPPRAYRDSYVYPPQQRLIDRRRYGPDSVLEPIRPPGDIVAPYAPAPGYAAPPPGSGYAPAPPPGYAAPPPAGYAPPPAGIAPGPADGPTGSIGAVNAPAAPGARAYAALPPDYRPEEGKPKELSPHLQRQIVTYPSPEPAGTIIVDTPNTFLYFVLGDGKAMRYGIGVGREGFTWSGVERISKMAEWPDWHPPKEMIDRQPYLPRFMAGGESNPLGARALYLGKSIYRIHGTNQPSTIGTFVSSGCIRLTNGDIEDLYRRVNVGSKVIVLTGKPPGNGSPAPAEQGAAHLPSSAQVIR